MYRIIIRRILFLFPPEKVHRFAAGFLRITMAIPFVALLARKIYMVRHPVLERTVFGIRFPNPVGIAAGFDKEAGLYNALSHFGFGHIEIGTVTPLGQPGNPQPRLFRLPKDKALINRMGFNNHGVQVVAERIQKNKPGVIIGGNIGKNTATPNEKAIDDYCNCFSTLFDHVNYFVINVSCPNIEGLSKLQDKDELTALLEAIQLLNHAKNKPKPILLKISPDLSDEQLDEVVDIVKATKLDGIIATNTSSKRDGLLTPKGKVESLGKGGLSGKPLWHKSVRTVSYLHHKTAGEIPIVAAGGIFTAEDAMEMLEAGASLIQVYTGFVYEGPSIARRINKQIVAKASHTP